MGTARLVSQISIGAPLSIHACRHVVGPCSTCTPSRFRIGEDKHVTHAQGSKGRGHIVARGARDGPARMLWLVQRAMLAVAILAALVVRASARDHAPVGIDGGQTRGALLAARQVASVDNASSGGLPHAHRARKLIEADPRYGSAVRRVLTDVGEAEGAGGDRGAGTPRAGAFDSTPRRRRGVNGVGVARLGRRVVDAEDELAAEANRTKPHLTSPRPARVASSTQRASSQAAGDDRPPIENGSRKPDPRWRLLEDDEYEQETAARARRVRRKRVQLLEWAAAIEQQEGAELRSKQPTPQEPLQQAEVVQSDALRSRSRGALELTTSDPEVRAVLRRVWDLVWPGRSPCGAPNPW